MKDKHLNDVLEFTGEDIPRDKDLMDEIGWDAGNVFELVEHLFDKGYWGDEYSDEKGICNPDFYSYHSIFQEDRLTINDLVNYLKQMYPHPVAR